MMYRNVGATPLVLTDGTWVQPGDTFDGAKAGPGQLDRWAVEKVARKPKKDAVSSPSADEKD